MVLCFKIWPASIRFEMDHKQLLDWSTAKVNTSATFLFLGRLNTPEPPECPAKIQIGLCIHAQQRFRLASVYMPSKDSDWPLYICPAKIQIGLCIHAQQRFRLASVYMPSKDSDWPLYTCPAKIQIGLCIHAQQRFRLASVYMPSKDSDWPLHTCPAKIQIGLCIHA